MNYCEKHCISRWRCGCTGKCERCGGDIFYGGTGVGAYGPSDLCTECKEVVTPS